MECIFERNSEVTYTENPYVKESSFNQIHTEDIPVFDEIKDRLPIPVWEEHNDEISCYYKAWELAFGNIQNPNKGSGFISPFIDTAFNGNLFMWDSSFILMFCKYAADIFNFQQTLDNMYARQHKDGYICREINEKTGKEMFTRFDPSSTGPNIMPWCEWEYFMLFGDKDRLMRVFPCLVAYHKWLKDNHTWRDGLYWSSGLGCGMDNIISRVPENYDKMLSNAHMVWADTNFQQILSADILIKMAGVLGRDREPAIFELKEEKLYLKNRVNELLWDDTTGFYYDLWSTGEHNRVKIAGAYWALLADVVPKDKLADFVSHLENEREFKRPHRVPTVSADDPNYHEDGCYWNGAVWAPTNYMILKGLEKSGYDSLAYDIALNHMKNVTEVYRKTGTLWENYMPERQEPGNPAKPDFVGWTGLVPIAVMFEYIFGIKRDAANNRIIWHINRIEEHGIKNYPLGAGKYISLICKARKSADDKPVIEKSGSHVEIEVRYGGKREII